MSRSRSPGSFSGTTEYHSPEGFVTGMVLTFVNTEDVTIGAGRCRDSTDTVDIVNSGTITVIIDGDPVTGINKLDTGTESGNTWYAVHVIGGNGKATAGLFSTNAASPTLPTGYTHFRRVGWVYNHSDNNFQNFVQSGNSSLRRCFYLETPNDYTEVLCDASDNSGADVDCSTRLPATADTAIYRFHITAGSTNVCNVRPGSTDSPVVWASLKDTEDERFLGEMPCGGTKGFYYITYGSGGAQSALTALVMGWTETL